MKRRDFLRATLAGTVVIPAGLIARNLGALAAKLMLPAAGGSFPLVVLDSEGVPARVESSKLVAGIESRYCVLVPSSLVHRARWVLADSDLTDAELDYLATGKLSDGE